MWFHLTTIHLYLPNADTVSETLHSEEFIDLVNRHGGQASYVLECPEQPFEFNYLTAWDSEEDADAFFESEMYKEFLSDVQPHLISPLCERRFEVMGAVERV